MQDLCTMQNMAHDAPQCPRCGYDQRGVVATWSDSCPLHGTCSECGLEFEWAPAISPHKFQPPWCIEFARGYRSTCMSAVRTYWRSFLPWRFWSQVQMSHPVRKRRLALYLFTMPLVMLLLAILLQAGTAFYVRFALSKELDESLAEAKNELANNTSFSADSFEEWANNMQGFRPVTVQDYIDYLFEVKVYHDARIENLKSYVASPPVLSFSYAAAIWEAVTQPWSRASSGSWTFQGMSYPYLAPITLHEYALSSTDVDVDFDEDWIDMTAVPLILSGVVSFMFPLAFVLLPASRRRAKVQWRHVFRVAAYSSFITYSLLVVAIMGLILAAFLATGLWQTIVLLVLVAFAIASPFMLIVWWWMALRLHLRMPHAFAVSFLLAVMLYLGTPIIIGLLAATLDS